jgi:phage baseplate assembly protein W
MDTAIEHILKINDFNRTDISQGLYAVARKMQVLMLMEPGTMPMNPDMGIGIKQYVMEFMDDTTEDEIRRAIDLQIQTYLPEVSLDEIIVERLISADGKTNTLGILIKIYKRGNVENVLFLFSGDKSISEIKSRIII